MSKSISNIIFLGIGLLVGSGVTYEYMAKREDERVNAEIEKFNEYQDRFVKDAHEKAVINNSKPDVSEYVGIIKQTDYTQFSNRKDDEEVVTVEEEPGENIEQKSVSNEIEILSEDSYYNDAPMLDYSNETWTFYTDGVVADDMEEIDEAITDISNYVGDFDIKQFFDSNDDNIVYVRNHKLGMDIEISRSLLSFKEYLENR